MREGQRQQPHDKTRACTAFAAALQATVKHLIQSQPSYHSKKAAFSISRRKHLKPAHLLSLACRARPHLAGVALLLVLLWPYATHGQETIVIGERVFECGGDQVEVQDGADLSSLQSNWAPAPVSMTYLLTGSTYTVSSPINIQEGVLICFIGQGQTGATATTVTVQGNGPYGWQVVNSDSGSGVLGLKNMVLVGESSYDGGAVSIGVAGDVAGLPALFAEGVAVRAFEKRAVLCWIGEVAMADCIFIGNGGTSVPAGGAIAATPQEDQSCIIELVDVSTGLPGCSSTNVQEPVAVMLPLLALL